MNRTSTNDNENPFGASFCYGNEQIIVEVTDNSHIATLTIYEGNQEGAISEGQVEDSDDSY